MRWLLYGDVKSRHAVDALVGALERAGQEVVEVPSIGRGLDFGPDQATREETQRRLDAALPADVVLNFRPEELDPDQVEELRRRGATTLVWLADDPLLFKVSYKHVAAAYDLTLHSAREDVLSFYERRLGVRGYTFPFWSDGELFSYGYEPDQADIEVGFLGNCNRRRRSGRYELLASLPWTTRFFGNMPKRGEDEAGIHAGFLEPGEFAAALRRFRVGISMAQTFARVRDRFNFRALPGFGEYFFPSRLVLYAAVGVPTVSLTLPGSPKPFPALITATDREQLVERISELIDDRDALLSASAAMRRDFESCLTADTRVALLLELIAGDRDHPLAERADLWRHFGRVPARADT